MTHDELLDKVELTLGTYISRYYGSKKDVELRSDVIDSLQALRAVVELHKPVQSYMFEEEACLHCSSEEDRSEILYPCPTIKAIEKELQ
jgi:hypothetical protein